MLTYLLGDLKQDPNPVNGDPSPLKYCIKASNARLLEILTHYGAYYIFDDVCNNVEKKVPKYYRRKGLDFANVRFVADRKGCSYQHDSERH